jgi:putative Mg2+ transporter-C (MgtC) family protein
MTETSLRLLLAALIGALIGLNRDRRHKDAGLRTHALVALGGALIVVASAAVAGTPEHRGDAISRAIQGVLTGIGFLGAGVILHDRDQRRVRGLTTAATIWLTALFGVACGVGAYAEVAVGMVIAFAILMFGGPIERVLDRSSRSRDDGPEEAIPDEQAPRI